MHSPLYLDVHILQSVPPSNLNRDDAGSPKRATYGGVARARVSSQAWKRATRKAFAAVQPAGDQATRTRQVKRVLADRIQAAAPQLPIDRCAGLAEAVISQLEIKPGKKADELSYLLFFGIRQMDDVASRVGERAPELDGVVDKELANALADISLAEALGHGHPADVALFGRMIADRADLNVDAAVQVAHAISTHAVEPEFDYFTAVDDENEAGETGAGMIGTVEFNSSTLYRFATLGVHNLLANLDGDAEATAHSVALFLDGFARSMPTGHQNSFGNRTRPAFVSVIARADQPVNLVGAFERPVSTGDGVTDRSIVELAATLREESDRWGDSPELVVASYGERGLERVGEHAPRDVAAAFGAPVPFETLVSKVRELVDARLHAKRDDV